MLGTGGASESGRPAPTALAASMTKDLARPRLAEVGQGLFSAASQRKARMKGAPEGESGIKRTWTCSAVGHVVEVP
jgi:hypothetical protein